MSTLTRSSTPSEGEKKIFKNYKISPKTLSHFNLKIYNITPVRAAFKLNTNHGILALKKTQISPLRLTFITEATNYVRQKGFYKVMEYIPWENDRYFLQDGNNIYVLTKWVEGSECNIKESQQEYEAAVTMAQFHEASRGFSSSVPLHNVSRLGFLEEDFQKYHKELEEFSIIVNNKSSHNKLDNIILKHNEVFIRQARQANELLKKINYASYIQRAQHTFALLHQDFAYHNLIWKNNEIFLIDLDYLTFDLRCIDLAKYLRRNLRLSNWKMRVADNIIAGYTSVIKLEREEFFLLYILLYFPYKYWQSFHIHFFENKKHRSKKKYKNIKKIISQQDNKEKFLTRFKEKYL